MRDDIGQTADDEMLISALTETVVVITANAENLATHSAQTAFVTAAILMARSAHRVHLIAPDVALSRVQPPLSGRTLVTGLVEIGRDMLPGIAFETQVPNGHVDLAIVLGDSSLSVQASQVISLNASDWTGTITRYTGATPWQGTSWPIGGMAAGAMAATEAFKIAMRSLKAHAHNPGIMMEMFAPIEDGSFQLAPPQTSCISDLGNFDCVSGGAITHSLMYVLARLPGVQACSRVFEPESAGLSNLNRYMLLRWSHRDASKAKDLQQICEGTGIAIEPVPRRFEDDSDITLRPLVIVGVDDIPSRWYVQRTGPQWLGIGATTHWSAMASYHERGSGGCAECLHPYDDLDASPIPTVAFVSFWAGLLTAVYFLRHRSGGLSSAGLEQQVYLTPLQFANVMWAGVPACPSCPTCAREREG
ncbi:hypothetical protein [Bradyrhizobium guangdongense]|nr:hypothetical protein [Bradyrhizobium guangdongense]